jgi:hypothetical protein
MLGRGIIVDESAAIAALGGLIGAAVDAAPEEGGPAGEGGKVFIRLIEKGGSRA